MSDLTEKQKIFVTEYLIDLNAKRAAERAGYSEKTAQEQGSRLLSNVKVQDEIQKAMKARETRTQITQDQVLTELIHLAKSDIRELFLDNNCLKDIKDLPESIARSIAAIEVEENFEGYGVERQRTGYTKKIKFWDKNKSLEMIGRHLKMFTDRIEVEVKDPLADRLKAARERAKNAAKGS